MTFETCLEPELIERVISSPAVQGLHGKPRYSTYMSQDTAPIDWIGHMGVDFDNRQHLLSTAVLAQTIAVTEGASEKVTYEAVLTAIVHDAAESVTGDVDFHKKEKTDDEEEIHMLDDMISDGRLLLTREELAVVQRVMRDKHNGPETEEGAIFDLSEVGGYQISAGIAWNAYKSNERLTDEQKRLLRLLAINVTAAQLAILFSYHDRDFKSPGIMLDGMRQTIDEIFEHGSDQTVMDEHSRHCHDKGFGHKAEQLEESFYRNRIRWELHNSQTTPSDRLVA